MAPVLILAYGNPLRGDDAIAWRAAEELQKTLPSSLAEIRALHQLTPELAETMSAAEAVIFLDAACDGQPGAIRCTAVKAEPQQPNFSHQMTPQSLLALCEQLYSARPRSFVVSVAGESFAVGEPLSPAAESALPQFVSTVHELADRLVQNDLPARESVHQQ